MSSSLKRFDRSDGKVVGTKNGDKFTGETSGVGENALELGIDGDLYSGIDARCCGSGSEPSKKLVEANSEYRLVSCQLFTEIPQSVPLAYGPDHLFLQTTSSHDQNLYSVSSGRQ